CGAALAFDPRCMCSALAIMHQLPPSPNGERPRAIDAGMPAAPALDAEDGAIPCLDGIALGCHRHGVLLHHLDFAKRFSAAALADASVRGAQPGAVPEQLLALHAHRPAIEQACGAGIGRRLHDTRRTADEGRALSSIDDLDRFALLVEL